MSALSEGVRKTAEIISERDNISLEDAIDLVESTLEEISAANYNPNEAEEIWQNNTGLEPDYLLESLM